MNKDEQKLYNLRYRQTHKKEIKKNKLSYYERHPSYRKDYNTKYYKKTREAQLQQSKLRNFKYRLKLRKEVGDSCIFCDSKIIRFHEVFGQSHSHSFARNFPENFIPSCFKCHDFLHTTSTWTKEQWKSFFYFQDLLRNKNGKTSST